MYMKEKDSKSKNFKTGDEKMIKHTPNNCCGKEPVIKKIEGASQVRCEYCGQRAAIFPDTWTAIQAWNRITATPDLLKACRYMSRQEVECSYCDGMGKNSFGNACRNCGGYGYNLEGDCMDALREIRAAIARAEKG